MTRHRLAVACATVALVTLFAPMTRVAGAATSTPPGIFAVYCSGSTSSALTGCYVDGASADLHVPAGSAVSTDPTVPTTAIATTGLTAPDGILGVIPADKAPAGVPEGATTFLYIDKQVNFFTPGAVTAKVTLPITNGSMPVSADYTGFGPGTYYLGGNTTNTIRSVHCIGVTPSLLTGCTSNDSATPDTVSKGNAVGAPGSCVASSAQLATIGEGNTKPKSLFKNNEDYAAVHMAYTTDGVHFHDVTPAGGITGLADPTAQTGLRWVSPGGTVITNPDGSLGIFFSAGVCTDGDSDAFGSVYYSTSTDGGRSWSAPSQISMTGSAFNDKLSTDYSYAASIANQPANNSTNKPLDISAYFEGRIYSPSVVREPNGTLTMTFAGYRTSKPLPATGAGAKPIGRTPGTTDPAAVQYTPQATEPALYRNILTVELTQVRGSNPARYTAGTPVVAQIQDGPWTLSQGDPTQDPYAPNGGRGGHYTTYTPGGGPTNVIGGVAYPNLSTYPGSGNAGTDIPYTTAYAGDPGPLNGYCGTGGFGSAGPAGSPIREPSKVYEPMSPYYFPHIERDGGGLTGFFDYRPKDSDEAVVIATSHDRGETWKFQSQVLELSAGHCPYGNSDTVAQTTNDDGEGHPSDLTVGGKTYLYTVVRASGVLDTVGSQFLAHRLDPSAGPSLGLPSSEPTGTSQSTVSVGDQTITATIGGVSTSTFNVTSTGTTEMPGRIYVTVEG
jgi:hypothetical protein